jgi:hypothetical protein
MLPSTAEEKQAIIDYLKWQAPDLTVEFLQKVYAENLRLLLADQDAVWRLATSQRAGDGAARGGGGSAE